MSNLLDGVLGEFIVRKKVRGRPLKVWERVGLRLAKWILKKCGYSVLKMGPIGLSIGGTAHVDRNGRISNPLFGEISLIPDDNNG